MKTMLLAIVLFAPVFAMASGDGPGPSTELVSVVNADAGKDGQAYVSAKAVSGPAFEAIRGYYCKIKEDGAQDDTQDPAVYVRFCLDQGKVLNSANPIPISACQNASFSDFVFTNLLATVKSDGTMFNGFIGLDSSISLWVPGAAAGTPVQYAVIILNKDFTVPKKNPSLWNEARNDTRIEVKYNTVGSCQPVNE